MTTLPADQGFLAANLRYYEDHAEAFVQSTAHLNLEEDYRPFLRRLTPGAHILDAGCGSGRDSRAFQEKGFRVTALDASPAMVQAARQLGVEAQQMTFGEMNFKSCFDGIWACASLLHVPSTEIEDVLWRLSHALRPGGVLRVSLKEGQGQSRSPEGRLFAYYTSDNFKAFLGRMKRNEIRVWSKIEACRVIDERARPWLNFTARKSARFVVNAQREDAPDHNACSLVVSSQQAPSA